MPHRFIEATDEPFVTAHYDRDHLAWVRGPITMMVDAAYAMLPYYAQGVR